MRGNSVQSSAVLRRSSGAESVGYGSKTVKDVLDTVTIYTDSYLPTQLEQAIDDTPVGGILRIGQQPMIGQLTKVRSDITIIGDAMPRYSNNGEYLEGGSIIRGTFVLDGDNITCENFGVDCGVVACDDLNSGAAMEGFIAHDITQTVLRKNNSFKNIVGLCRLPSDAVHAVLIEGQEDGAADNIHGRSGNFGVVFKVARFQIGKAVGYENGETGVYLKSDSYGPVQQVNAQALNYFDMGAGATAPVAIHASSAPLQDVNIASINVSGGGERQVRFISNTSGVNIMEGVNVDSVNCRGATAVSMDTYGVVYNLNIAKANLVSSATGKYLLVQEGGRNVQLGQINCIETGGNNNDDAVVLAGFCSFDNIVACENYNYDVPAGIRLHTAVSGGLKCKIGDYVGRLNVELDESDLENSWATAFGQSAGCIVRNGIVQFYGRLDANNVGVGKETFFTLDSFLVPFTQRNFMCQTYAGLVGNRQTVLVTVSSGGAVAFPELNVAGQWPGTGGLPAASWIDLNGIYFELNDKTY